MVERPQNIRLRLSGMQMSLRRVILVEVVQPIYTWFDQLVKQVMGRGAKTDARSKPINDPTKGIKGRNPKRLMENQTTIQNRRFTPPASTNREER